MHSAHGIIFAYEATQALQELVAYRTSSSLPFGARYRLIDFPLSNMVNAGISDIGVIMQRGYQSLLDHLGAGRDWDLTRRVGGLKLLPPFGYTDMPSESYRSRIDALKGVYSYLTRIRQEYVILCRGDVAANIPLDDVLRQHVNTGADVTVVCTPRPELPIQESTFLVPGGDGLAREAITNPLQVPSGYQSLEHYVLSRELLLRTVEYGSSHDLSARGDFARIITETGKTGLYLFDRYVAAAASVPSYYQKSMALLRADVRAQLFLPDRSIKTKERSDVATYYGSNAKSKNCLVADGCYIEGEIENSILFRGVRIERDCVLRNCILMQDTVVGRDARLNCVIADKDVVINPGVTLSGHEAAPMTIGKGAKI